MFKLFIKILIYLLFAHEYYCTGILQRVFKLGYDVIVFVMSKSRSFYLLVLF